MIWEPGENSGNSSLVAAALLHLPKQLQMRALRNWLALGLFGALPLTYILR